MGAAVEQVDAMEMGERQKRRDRALIRPQKTTQAEDFGG